MHGYLGDDPSRRFSIEVPEDLTEYEDIAPYLLGRDVGAVVDSDERRRISDFVTTIEDEALGRQILARLSILGPVAWRNPDAVLERIRAFQRGMDER
jgi:hypothetical protein